MRLAKLSAENNSTRAHFKGRRVLAAKWKELDNIWGSTSWLGSNVKGTSPWGCRDRRGYIFCHNVSGNVCFLCFSLLSMTCHYLSFIHSPLYERNWGRINLLIHSEFTLEHSNHLLTFLGVAVVLQSQFTTQAAGRQVSDELKAGMD